jgi:hypothetical protein
VSNRLADLFPGFYRIKSLIAFDLDRRPREVSVFNDIAKPL